MDEHLLPEEFEVGHPWRAPWDVAPPETPAEPVHRRVVGMGGVVATALALAAGWFGLGSLQADGRHPLEPPGPVSVETP